jgi:hypothetical protein
MLATHLHGSELERVELLELALDEDDIGIREPLLVLDLNQHADRTLMGVIPGVVCDLDEVTGFH